VSLNKQFPGIPKRDQFRPIVIVSPFVKFLELRFIPQLNDYMLHRMSREQTGFVKGFGTHVNLRLLIEEIKKHKRSEQQCIIFIDFKSAYNTVNRERLFQIVQNLTIFSNDEIAFLKLILDKLYFKTQNGEKYYFKNGVPQGMSTSPALFNIYIEDFMKNLQETYGHKIWHLLYADDLVISVNRNELESIIRNLQTLANVYQLKLSPKKCGIFIC